MSHSLTDEAQRTYWRRCSSCKKEIPFEAVYQQCSVSTCRNSKRTGLVFCCVACWDAHLGFAKHRSSEACEVYAPSRQEFLNELANEAETSAEPAPQRRVIVRPAEVASHSKSAVTTTETLVVVSKVKSLIREQSEFNTSACAIDALTQKVVDECLKAIEQARASGRKTVMGRDF